MSLVTGSGKEELFGPTVINNFIKGILNNPLQVVLILFAVLELSGKFSLAKELKKVIK